MNRLQIVIITALTLTVVAAWTGPVWGDYIHVANTTNAYIPDLGSVTRSLPIASAPTWARVNKVEYLIRIDDAGDPSNFWCVDYEVLLTSSAHSGNVLVYDNHGWTTDGGWDDDVADDSDIYLYWRTTHAFDGEPVNQTWSAIVRDTWWLGVGELNYVQLRIHYPPFAPDLVCDNLTISPNPPVAGQVATLSVAVRNNGATEADGFYVKFYISQDETIDSSDRYLNQVSLSNLSAGGSVSPLEMPIIWPSDISWRNYYIGCIVDGENEVAEADESNNTASASVPPRGGLKGEYFNNLGFTSLAMTRQDATINFDWGDGSPNAGQVDPDTFSVRWTADLAAPFTDSFTFLTRSDDGVRVWLDGMLIIDNWTDHAAVVDTSCPITLMGGQRYSLCMEMYENDGQAVAELYWESPSQPTQIIPTEVFSQPLLAHMPRPANGATDADDYPTLTWRAGGQAVQHKVYFGTDPAAPSYRGQQASTTYSAGALQWGQTYYWRVDEVQDDGTTTQGKLWQFTVADYLVVDNFEDYTALAPNRIFDAWIDGTGDSQNGGEVGHVDAPYVERLMVHEGSQSMPFSYDNGQSGYVSQADRTFSGPQDWTRDGVKVLTVWYKGIAPGSYSSQPGGVHLMSAQGVDIWETADQFHYAYKRLTGSGSIQARVMGVSHTNTWAKAGVMIRETLDESSKFAMNIVTPGQGVHFQTRRNTYAQATSDTDVANTSEWDASAPLWVKIERDGNTFRGYRSTNGSSWTPMAWNPQVVSMTDSVYIGLCLTSHCEDLTCRAAFSSVQTNGAVTGSWNSRDIGIVHNGPQPMYVQLEAAGGGLRSSFVSMDTGRVLAADWQPWNIPLQRFGSGLDLRRIQHVRLGIGDPGRPTPGGSGRVYFDDVRLRRMAQQALWIPGEEPPQLWDITTSHPDTRDVIHLSGPLDRVYHDRAVAEQNMGVPAVKIDTFAKTVELVFESSVTPMCAGAHYDPVCGVEAWFGPLSTGTWEVFCNEPGTRFSSDFTVSP